MWQFLYFLPLPHQHGLLRPGLYSGLDDISNPCFLHNHSAACQRVSIQAIIASTCIAEYNIFAGEAQTRNGNFDLAPGLGLEPRIFCFKGSCPRRLDDPGVFVDSGRQIRTVDLDLMGVMRTAAPLSRYEAGGAGLEPASIRINSAAHSPGLLPAIECPRRDSNAHVWFRRPALCPIESRGHQTALQTYWLPCRDSNADFPIQSRTCYPLHYRASQNGWN